VNTTAGEARYVERARSYLTVTVLFGVLVAGCVADLALSKQPLHVFLWAGAAVVVCGIMTIATRAANEFRTITVTDDEVMVGDHALERSAIVAVERAVPPDVPVLGQRLREGMPKGVRGLTLRLADGAAVAVPTRRPEALTEALRMPVLEVDIRPFEADDLPALEDIERRVLVLYRMAGTPLPDAWLCVAQLGAAAVVLVSGRPARAFVRVDEVDGQAHLFAVAVDPPLIGTGVGARLLDAAFAWAREHGYRTMTTTAFADARWNTAFLVKHGFAEAGDLTPGLAELRHWERTIGLDAVAPRVALRRDV
jgi:GNAT superfamily N-acetyltransferase